MRIQNNCKRLQLNIILDKAHEIQDVKTLVFILLAHINLYGLAINLCQSKC